MRGMLVQMLSNEHIEVESVCNGKEALKILQEFNFDLVITDLIMPLDEAFIESIKVKNNQLL